MLVILATKYKMRVACTPVVF